MDVGCAKTASLCGGLAILECLQGRSTWDFKGTSGAWSGGV